MMLKYHVRSVMLRPVRALLTAAGIGLAVFVAVAMLALAQGIGATFRATGNPLNVLVTSRGAETIEFSALDRAVYEKLRHAPEAAESEGGTLVSPEILFAAGHQSGPRVAQALVRGVLPAGAAVHEQVRLVEGRFPAGGREVAVGPLVALKLELPAGQVAVGQKLVLDGVEWTITGRFEAPGTAFEAEIWGPLDALMAAYRKEELNSIVIRARDEAALDELLFDLDTRRDVVVAARRETDYYAAHAGAFRPIAVAVNILAGLLAAGGTLIGMNTLFASVTSRTRELGMLRTLGFRRVHLAAGFAAEGLLPALAGSVVALVAVSLIQGFALHLPMGAFRLQATPGLLATGLALGVFIGLAGSLAGIARVVRLSTIQAIRHL